MNITNLMDKIEYGTKVIVYRIDQKLGYGEIINHKLTSDDVRYINDYYSNYTVVNVKNGFNCIKIQVTD